VGDVFQFVEAGEAGGVDRPDFAFDGAAVFGGFNHTGKTAEGVKFVAGLRVGNGDERLAGEQTVVGETAFE